MIIAFATYRNQDMTEGRGPMVLDKVFLYEEDAETYILQQDGIMGRKPEIEYGWDRMGDWKVKPLIILQSLADGEEHVRKQNLEQAWAKLTEGEREAMEAYIRSNLT